MAHRAAADDSANLRFRWEYAPGSELFLVGTDERDVRDDRYVTPTSVRGLKDRAFVIKINRLFHYWQQPGARRGCETVEVMPSLPWQRVSRKYGLDIRICLT